MTVVSNIVTRITANSAEFNQVLDAQNITRDTIDTSVILYGLVKTAVSNRAYPLKYPENPTLPALVYQLVGSEKQTVDGLDVLQQDRYILSFCTAANTDYDTLITLRETIRDALTGYDPSGIAGVIEIQDEALEFLDHQNRYECVMEVIITHIMGDDQTVPAAIVYENSNGAAPSQTDNCVRQQRTQNIVVLLVMKYADIDTIRDSLLGSMLGYQVSTSYSAIEYIGGERVHAVAGFVVWREHYTTEILITEA